MTTTKKNDFGQLLLACQEMAHLFPEGLVFIGGIAGYLYTINHRTTQTLAEVTHDADFYISLADMSDLRDMEEIVANRRLNKHQLIKRGFEFDIYTERHSSLLVPYDQVMAHSVLFDALRVASLEHLLVLKLEAYRNRYASTKGQKDAKDLIRIALVICARKDSLNLKLCMPYLSEDHVTLIERVARGPEFLGLARGNAKSAKEMRTQFAEVMKKLS